MTLFNTRLTDNTTSGGGGGAYLQTTAIVTIRDGSISGSDSGFSEERVFLRQGDDLLSIAGARPSSNNQSWGDGGGIQNDEATVSIIARRPFTDNSSGGTGGGVYHSDREVAPRAP